MKAIGLTQVGGPEVLQVVDLPEPQPGPGEVRIRVHAVAVNPTDLTFRAGGRAAQLADRPPPYIPGMDVAGVVDKLGAGTDGLVTLKGWTGPSERGIVIHPISSFGSATDTALFDRLRRQAEYGVLTLRVAEVLPAKEAAEAHRRLAAGGVRGRLVLDFFPPL
jgi:NADPH:quinone reductase-like Zn-dependent oxidoreductase